MKEDQTDMSTKVVKLLQKIEKQDEVICFLQEKLSLK